ncbi:MAG TPA: hypothetical protein VLM91_19835 [Candidatus Methylomirabilis sp.]|nr:hypothetical protein [Candidatus Methylomirabilis sp.]
MAQFALVGAGPLGLEGNWWALLSVGVAEDKVKQLRCHERSRWPVEVE